MSTALSITPSGSSAEAGWSAPESGRWRTERSGPERSGPERSRSERPATGTPEAGPAGAPELLAVDEHLAPLLPWGGLRRGEVVAVASSTSLALALLARASREGAWCAIVGVETLGLAAAHELGVELDHLALVPRPGERWPEVVAALVDALDAVVLRPPRNVPPAISRQLRARLRSRGGVLLTLPTPGSAGLGGAALRLSAVAQRWEGLGDGHGHLRRRHLTVRAEGQGAAARPRTHELWLPAAPDERRGTTDVRDTPIDAPGTLPASA